MEAKPKVDKEAIKASLKAKYPDMPEPGTGAWTEFLKGLKESSPEDYRSALLLGGGVTQALRKEIARSQRRDQLKEIFARLFLRDHPTGKVPDKRKIGVLIFLLVGGLFAFAFFFGTAPKKKAEGGGVGTQAVSGIIGKGGEVGEGPTISVEAKRSGQQGKGSFPTAGEGTSTQESGEGGSSTGSGADATGVPGQDSTGVPGAPSSGDSLSANPGGMPGPLPPPPPPVYGSYASPVAPPDPSLGQGQVSLPGPPPMVLYASPGVPSQAPPGGVPAAGVQESEVSAVSPPSPSPMLVQQVPTGGMLVVSGSAPTGMTVAQDQGTLQGAGSPYPANPPGNPGELLPPGGIR